jgi:hypothetical protein
VDQVTRHFLLYVLMPFWAIPALLDWRFHRRSRIEDTTGMPEALLHTAMMVEVGVPIAAAFTLRITRPVFAGMCLCAAAHQLTTTWDVRMAAESSREVTPGEQQVHSFMEVLPLSALASIAALHWHQIRHPRPHERAIQRRRPPLPRWYLGTAAAAAVAGVAGPYADEMRRCLRARHR